MKTPAEDVFRNWPAPGRLLRESAFVCLVGAWLCIIVTARTQALWAREMISYLPSPLLAFALLYLEYKVVELVLKRELDRRWGYAQALGCMVISLYGALAVLGAASNEQQIPTGLSERTLLLLCILGEAVFVGNVIATYKSQEAAGAAAIGMSSATVAQAPAHARSLTAAPSLTSDWLNSPVAIFGISAAFFAIMGSVFARVGFLTTEVPVGWNGATTQVSAGYLCASTSLPFAVFAAAYLLLELRFHMSFALNATRIHFVCTLLAVLEAIHVYMGWAATWASTSSLKNPVTIGDFGGALALGALACGCFVWNVVLANRLRLS